VSKCATCWRDPAISHWLDPGDHKPRGTSLSNWVCHKCRRKPTNRHWTCTPSEEVYGIEHEDHSDASPVVDSIEGQYETPLCIEIIRLYAFSIPQRDIAKRVGTPLSYVAATIRYWKTHRGYFLGEVKRILSKPDTQEH